MPQENSKDALERRNQDSVAQLGGSLVRRALADISGLTTIRQNEGLETKHATVLVIDDEPLVTEFLCGFLRDEGYDADSAEDGDVGVERIRMKEYQLVILNIRMPRMDGLEALPLIKMHSLNTRVIMYSGNCYPENNAKAFTLGASACISKPASADEILDSVRKVLQAHAT